MQISIDKKESEELPCIPSDSDSSDNNNFLKHLHSFTMINLQLYTSLITGSVKLTVSILIKGVLAIKQK